MREGRRKQERGSESVCGGGEVGDGRSESVDVEVLYLVMEFLGTGLTLRDLGRQRQERSWQGP
jgi:hypothetical protein